jgi:hypothetical protein
MIVIELPLTIVAAVVNVKVYSWVTAPDAAVLDTVMV